MAAIRGGGICAARPGLPLRHYGRMREGQAVTLYRPADRIDCNRQPFGQEFSKGSSTQPYRPQQQSEHHKSICGVVGPLATPLKQYHFKDGDMKHGQNNSFVEGPAQTVRFCRFKGMAIKFIETLCW